jgi:two-component system, sensor histidine kinase
VGISSWIAHRDARALLLDNLRQSIAQDGSVIRLRLETWMRGLQEDTRSTSQSPLFAAFLQARNTNEEALWRGLLEDEFRAVFAGKPAYFQLRLLHVGGEQDGEEILRLDRLDDRLVVTPRERLQKKAGRSYYQEALIMPPGMIYLSEINLNRDFGGITEPHTPTIRAAARIGTESSGQAMLVINADLRSLFNEVRELASPASEIRLANENGDFLMHPDPKAVFGSDLGHAVRFPVEEEVSELSLSESIPLGGWPARTATLMVSLPDEAWRPGLAQSSRRGIWATALAALSGASLAVLISLPFTRRLRRLSLALRQFDGTESAQPLTLPDPGKDEIGIAIDRFREMALKVREHVEALHAARHEAEEANAAKETFLAVMSHEIRTPMNAVVGLIRALENNHPAAHQQPILTSLRSSASNLMTLLNTALDYTRLREGAMRYASEIFDAATLGKEVADSLKPSALAKRLDLQVRVPASLMVQGDPVRLRQVLNNLLGNALKFTESGFVNLTLSHQDDQLICVVSDSGPGIRGEDKEKVFTPFFTFPESAANTAPGAGLGLSVSRQMIEQQGGCITLESQPGKGATFTVRLPYPERSTDSMPTIFPNSGSEPNVRHGLRILYVEDVPSNQEVMSLTLERTGCDLTCVDTATEALTLLGQRRFDLIMIDLQLPDMSGYELAAAIRASHPATPMIAVTAQSSDKAANRCLEVGMTDVVLKPYSAETLLGAISKQTDHSFAEELLSLHHDDPKRSRALAATMAEEFRAAAHELASLQANPDMDDSIQRIRDVQHKLKTAVARFRLVQLDEVLGQLTSSRDHRRERLQRALGLLETTANNLAHWSQQK